MLGILRRNHHALVKLVIFGLLFQAFATVLPARAMFLAANPYDDIASDYIVICTGEGLQRIALHDGAKAPSQPAADIECHICLAMSACSLALAGDTSSSTDFPRNRPIALRRGKQDFRDHRPAIRPGRGPPQLG